MGSFAQEQQQWVVQPLVDVGVELEEIRDLVFRLVFDDIVSGGRDTLTSLGALVADRPAEVQAAWAQLIGRLLMLELLA